MNEYMYWFGVFIICYVTLMDIQNPVFFAYPIGWLMGFMFMFLSSRGGVNE